MLQMTAQDPVGFKVTESHSRAISDLLDLLKMAYTREMTSQSTPEFTVKFAVGTSKKLKS